MQKYDAIVVGAGNGGLGAACKLAKAGKKTLLIEQHNLPGGVATSFRRGRFEFEVALHELCDWGSEEDPGETRKLLKNTLGLDIPWHRVDDVYRYITTDENGNKLDVTMPAGRQAYIDKMEYYVHGSRKSIENFFALGDEYTAALVYIREAAGNPDPKYMLKHFPNFLRTVAYPSNAVLKALKIPQRAIDIINCYWSYAGVDCDRMSALCTVVMTHKYVCRYPYIPDHTSHQMSTGLVERFRAFGGECRFNCRAEEILFDKSGHVCGLRTDTDTIETRHIIWNGNPSLAYANAIPAKNLPERNLKMANASRFSARMLVVYLGLNKTAEELGIKDYSVFYAQSADTRREYDSMARMDTNKYFISLCYNIANPNASPEGTSILSLTTFYNEDVWANVSPDKYVKVKNKIAEDMIDAFEKTLGVSVKPYIEEIEVATSWTFARYAASPEGGVYGYELEPWNSILPRNLTLKQDDIIPGLKFAGAAGPRGLGFNASQLCGAMMADMTVKEMEKEEK